MRTVTATGDVHYSDNQIKLKGPKARSNLNTKDTDVYEGDYQMVGRQGRGDADKMKMRGANRYTILKTAPLPPVCRATTAGAWSVPK